MLACFCTHTWFFGHTCFCKFFYFFMRACCCVPVALTSAAMHPAQQPNQQPTLHHKPGWQQHVAHAACHTGEGLHAIPNANAATVIVNAAANVNAKCPCHYPYYIVPMPVLQQTVKQRPTDVVVSITCGIASLQLASWSTTAPSHFARSAIYADTWHTRADIAASSTCQGTM